MCVCVSECMCVCTVSLKVYLDYCSILGAVCLSVCRSTLMILSEAFRSGYLQ